MDKNGISKRVWLAIGFVIVILALLGVFADVKKVFELISDVDLVILGAAAACFVVSVFLITTRWRYILDFQPEFLSTLHADGISYAGKLFVPIPLAVLRVVTLSMLTPMSISGASPGAVIDRLVGFIMRLIALALTVLFIANAPLSPGLVVGGILFILALFGLTVLLVRNAAKILPKLAGFISRLPGITEGSLQGIMSNLQHGLTTVGSTRKLIIALLISLVMWTFFLLFYALSFSALGLRVDTHEMFAMAAAVLVILPPSNPAMIGVYQGIIVAVLLPFGYLDVTEATAFAILIFVVQLIIWLILAVWGLRRG
ncbi:MAG: lysylphosphatidylglycerol synthase transmembrane domain-containing protein, partial [Chloroflexota bacterium]|nr:lysylphosphatidylglycerol synthase transmembrane domain-containing protein [Chloroflexota bacterium]